jgi:uncharacterized protein YdaU (DUF1376 family)
MVGLTLEERGAYITILNLIYDRAGPIPEDAWWITSNLGCTTRTWVKVRAALIVKRKLYAVEIDGQPHLMNERADEEIGKLLDLHRTLSASGHRGGRNSTTKPNKNKEETQATLKPGLSQAQALQIQITDTEEEDANASLSAEADVAKKDAYPPDFELAWKAYPHVTGRSGKRKSHGYWRRLPQAQRTALPAAIGRYARNGREPHNECGAPAMERWLRDEKFLDWLDPATEQPTVVPLRPSNNLADQIAAQNAEARRIALERMERRNG